LFEYRSINHLIDDIYNNFDKANAVKQYQPISKRANSDQVALSYSQERLWFLYKYEQKNAYNVPVLLEIDSTIEPAIARKALDDIIQRHEILRTNFLEAQNNISGPTQKVNPFFVFDLPTVSLDESTTKDDVEKIIKESQNEIFDLSNDLLIRASLYKIENRSKSYLLINMHHIVCDGWSIEILMKEFVTLYKAYLNKEFNPISKLPILPIQYSDYAIWQREHLSTKVMDDQLSFWKQQFANVESLQLPTTYPRPSIPSGHGNSVNFQISKVVGNKLKKISKGNDVTLFMTLLTAFNVLLQRYSGQDDIVIGTVTAGRGKVEIETLMGFFVNTVALRQDLSDNPAFNKLLQKVKRTTLDAYKHQYVPFEKVVDALGIKRDPSRSPLFQVMLELNNIELSVDLPIKAKELNNDTSKFDLALRFTQNDGELPDNLEYATDLFGESYIKRLIGNFKQLINSIIENPKQNISQLNILTTGERQQILSSYNDTQSKYPKDKCLHDLFEQQVKQTPNNIAVTFENESLTYQELNQKSNQLARYIRNKYNSSTGEDLKPDTLIGISIDRSLEMIIGIIAILKAGGAYVPLDPNYPKDRLNYMAQDSNINMVLTTKSLRDESSSQFINDKKTTIICLDLILRELDKEEDSNLKIGNNSSSLAYVIYTSGSTGMPKGVMIEHRGLVNMTKSQSIFGIKDSDNILQFASLNFDASIFEIILALTNGANLTLIKKDVMSDQKLLQQCINDQKITIGVLTPVILSMLNITQFNNLRTLISMGEECPHSIAKLCSGKLKFFNAYGPTENTIWSSIYKCDANKLGQVVPIGKPTCNVQFHILDKDLNLVPKGVIGELYIAGDSLARGYLNRDDLTQEKFVKNPFSSRPKSRMYKSGDLVKYLEDGNLEYCGRTDDQIKIRGFRIELGEIEQQLYNIKDVKDSAIIVKEGQDVANKILVAYVVTSVDIDIIKSKLEQKLPGYMIPALFIKKDSLPATPNGKIDRKALQSLDIGSVINDKYVAPKGKEQKILCDIFGSILNVAKVGIHDDFFELGGNSLSITRLAVVINKQFPDQIIDIKTLFLNSDVSKLAKYITSDTNDNEDEEIILENELGNYDNVEYLSTQEGNYENPQAIFLTGATGFVGVHLLQNLLSKTSAKLYCLIRGSSLEKCEDKLKLSIKKYGVVITSEDWSRINLVNGDLEKKKFALDNAQYSDLVTNIDLIIHSGAFVNHLYRYDQLKKANVEATYELIKMCKSVQRKKLIFISTMSVLKDHNEDQEDVDISSFKFTQTDGYTASKWVSEMMIKNSDIDYQINRISRVGGDTKSNIGPLNDMTYRYWKTCLMLGKYPAEFNHWKEDIRPIDQTVEIIATLAMKHELNRNVFHLNNQKQIGINEPLEVAKKNISLEEVPLEEWMKLLETGKLDGKDLPFYPYLGLVKMTLGNKATQHANDNILHCVNNKNTMKLLPLATRTFQFSDDQLMRYINQCNET
jgi:amino acid adenylation domain-containing protein/thioester reductase-like protein